ncbi:O-methyltransferase [Magnetospirillum sp. SS-4]|uniref:O-methyltransferase n=1 Tax=Magnetospirillum sp. SS-4 TaxID=2681465 RepID=UPI00137C4657|nr:O-methyltransferase [Magnetospirillum sp. SS-4]CAA7615151.1 conserved hypothetical protein [Magnetospirillum sp. SS-4]
MAKSYRKIDYRIRPAKYAERNMLCAAFQKIRFGSIESYQYIGMGSVYFSDFILFHRALGISRMISIEKEEGDQQRFLDNLPFSFIEMNWGTTTTQLPNIDLSLRSIAWLDYDGRLSRSVLDDVRSFVSRACSGSILIVSVQCNPEGFSPTEPTKNVQAIRDELGDPYVEINLTDADLLGWGTAKVFRKAIINQIEEALALRNSMRPDPQKMLFRQIFNFHYEDGAKMMTVGVALFDRGQQNIFDQCGFAELDFTRNDEAAFRIDVPKLTSRELKKLESQMPLKAGTAIDYGSMPESDAHQFAKVYRYLPNFVATDF